MLQKIANKVHTIPNEKGETLPAIMVASLLTVILFPLLAATMTDVMQVQREAVEGFVRDANSSEVRAALESDLGYDLVRTATPTHLEFGLVDEGSCREAIWDITDNKDLLGNLTGSQSITRQLFYYENADCTGERKSHEAVSIPATNAAFEVFTHVGREVEVANGLGTFVADDTIPNPDDSKLIARANENALAKQVVITSDEWEASARNSSIY